MTGARIFGRRIRATITRPVTSYKTIDTVDALVVEDLRMRWETKTALKSGEPNSCTLDIHNLAPGSRAQIGVGSKLILEVGYEGRLEQMFVGDVMFAPSAWEGPTAITRISALDGGRALRWARINESIAGPVSLATIVRRASEALGVGLGNALDVVAAIGTAKTQQGYVMTGRAADVLSDALEAAGYSWSVQDGQIQILADDASSSEVIHLSPESGLVGSPVLTQPVKKGGPAILKAKAKARKFPCGGRVALTSAFHSGVWKVMVANGMGDTHGSAWDVQLDLVATKDQVIR